MREQEVTPAAVEFDRLLEIMERLRAPGGCPWDAKQTHASLVRYLIEESYEVVEAIEMPEGVDRELLQEELGDVLLQVVFHASIAAQTPTHAGGFSIAEVLGGLNSKLERRHPHVFGDESKDLETVRARWEDLKKEEKPNRGPLDGIPPHLPALSLAEKTVAKAKKAGIALEALAPAVQKQQVPTLEDETELGSYLFSLVAHAQAAGLDPERALRNYTRGVLASQQHPDQ